MKSINVTYDKLGRVSEITSKDMTPYMIEAEAGNVDITAFFPGDFVGYNAQGYIKNSAGGDVVELGTLQRAETDGETDLSTVTLPLESKHLVKGNLYVGFELFKDNVYVRFEKLRFDVNSFVDVSEEMGEGMGDYTVMVEVGEVSLSDSDSLPSVINTGTKRNVVLNFAFPRNVTFAPVLDGTVLKWVRKDVTDETETTTFDLTAIVPTKVSELENDAEYLTEQDISGKADKEQSGGGFIGGRNAKVGDNNDNPGAALGTDSYACWGVSGGALSRTNGGASLGAYTYSYDGGSVGLGAATGNGFAGGLNAKAIDTNGNAIDAVQLGTGTNNEEKTLQVFEYKLLKSDGLIPPERMYMDIKDQTPSGDFTLELGDGQEHRFFYGALAGSTMTITFPSQISEGYISNFVFNNRDTSWTLVYSKDIMWSGDDIVNDAFVPQLNTRYNIMFWFDGMYLNAVARGVSIV